MLRIIVCAAAIFAATQLGACASIVEGSSQSVLVTTPGVPDATCTLTSPEIGSQVVRTPGSLTLSKSKHDVQVACTKEGYNDGAGTIASNFEGMTLGNLLIGGIIGVGIDAASGAMNKYQPQVAVVMTKKDGTDTPGDKQSPVANAPVASNRNAPTAKPAGEPEQKVADEAKPSCKDVGGYEAYMAKTGKICML
jgi:hypothetical protein